MTFTNFIKRPVLSTVISIFFVLLGTIGLISLPVEQYPDIAPPTISVSTTYTGADAQTVLNSVIVPLEESINGVENMTYMTSSATNDGMANITQAQGLTCGVALEQYVLILGHGLQTTLVAQHILVSHT